MLKNEFLPEVVLNDDEMMPKSLFTIFIDDINDSYEERDEQMVYDCILHFINSLNNYKTVENAEKLISTLDVVLNYYLGNKKILKMILKLLRIVFDKAKINVQNHSNFFSILFNLVLEPESEKILYLTICCFISILNYDNGSDDNFNYISNILNPNIIIKKKNFLQLKGYYLLLFECYCMNKLNDEKGRIIINVVKFCLENILDKEDYIIEIIIHLLSNYRINSKNSIHIIYESGIIPYLEGLNFYLSEESIITILTIYGEIIQQETINYPIFDLKKLLKYKENQKILDTVIWLLLVYIEECDAVQQFFNEPQFIQLLFDCINIGSSNLKINSFLIYSRLIQQANRNQITSLLNFTIINELFEAIELIEDSTIKTILLDGLITVYKYLEFINHSLFWDYINKDNLIEYLSNNLFEENEEFSSRCSYFLNLINS